MGYIANDNPDTLTIADLTLKGVLATEVNEGHPILMTELYTQEIVHNVSANELVSILSCFIGDNKSNNDTPQVNGHPILQQIEKMAESFKAVESTIGYPLKDYWTISTDMVEPIRRWMQGEHASVICVEYELFEGNFIRAVMKLANLLDEWLSMATYCQHIEQINKVVEVRQYLVRDLVVSDSLYLRL
jgi:superfamily II RNA helicase